MQIFIFVNKFSNELEIFNPPLCESLKMQNLFELT